LLYFFSNSFSFYWYFGIGIGKMNPGLGSSTFSFQYTYYFRIPYAPFAVDFRGFAYMVYQAMPQELRNLFRMPMR